MFICHKNRIIKAVSESYISLSGTQTIETPELDHVDKRSLVGKRIRFGPKKSLSDLKVAFIGNWGDPCGISTYTQALVSALRSKVKDLRVFAEHSDVEAEEFVHRCWKRGESMTSVIDQIVEWGADVVHVEHEFGLFPKATHFLKMLEALDALPYVVTLHSVYQHLDKSVCTAYLKNVIVHSAVAKQVLLDLGHLSNIHVIPHGCIVHEDTSELWNIFQTDYTIIQFGFGFGYKGVDVAIEAIRILKETDPKFKDIFYCYLCSENPNTKHAHEEYYGYIKDKIDAAGLGDHIAVMRGFLSDQLIRNFLRTAKLAIFPYQTDPKNCVYGASGAVRHAMANGIPVVASDSHLFDDLDGVLPRVKDAAGLAGEIDKVFSDWKYKKELVEKNLAFLKQNDWEITADRHLATYQAVMDDHDAGSVRVIAFKVIE